MTRNGYQHMVLDFYVDRLRHIRATRGERLRALRTAEQVRQYQCHVRQAICAAFGPRPPRTPLNPRITGCIEKADYRIEKLLFESRPGCLVTANLYLPRERRGPAPGVIGTCGHSEDGKAAAAYQEFCQRLVHNGFIVLIYDPFNQGERDQYAQLEERQAVASCCSAHNMMGKQLELIGEFFGMWRAWDGIRALDVLLERPDVDPTRIGLTGNSGGGTMTTWLWGLEERFTMAAPSCFVTSFLTNLENELPADCEQYPPGVIGAGLEMVDFLIARAPLPALLLGQTHDFFERRGLFEAHDELSRVYEILGASDNTNLFVGPLGHGYSWHNQEAMVEFFCRHAGIEPVVRVAEPDVLAPEDLYVTPNGNVIAAGATPIRVQIRALADPLHTRRSRPQTEALTRTLQGLLGLPDDRPLPHYRVPRPLMQSGVRVARYAVETEPGIRAILRKRLVQDNRRGHALDVETEVLLYLPHVSAEEEMGPGGEARGLNRPRPLYALDVRGLGESMPEPHGSGGFFQSYGMDYMLHGHGILFGRSYLGQRVYDVLCVMDLLRNEGAKRITLHGRGQGAILALFAGLLHGATASVVLKNGPLSYAEWVAEPIVAWPAANCLRGVLRHFDLPDCILALGDRVRLDAPWDARMEPVNDDRLTAFAERTGIPMTRFRTEA